MTDAVLSSQAQHRRAGSRVVAAAASPMHLAPPLLIAATTLVLGVFRHGAILPADRPALVIPILAVGGVWLGAMVVLRRRLPHPLRGFSRPGRMALTGLIALSLLSLLSVSWSLAPGRSLWWALVYACAVVSFYGGRALWRTAVLGTPLLILALAGVGALVCWVSIVGYSLDWPSWVGSIGEVTHALGPFGYANGLASFITLTLPASIWLTLDGRAGWPVRLLAAGSAVLQLWAMWLTHSRGAVGALAGATVLLALVPSVRAIRDLRSVRIRGALLVAAVVGLAAVLTASAAFGWQRIGPVVLGPDVKVVSPTGALPEHVAGVTIKPMTADGYRVNTWIAAAKAVQRKPIAGWGADTFFEAYGPFKPGGQTRFAHNVVVQHAVELGLLGSAALALLAVGAVAACIATAARSPFRHPATYAGISVIAFLVHNLADLTWYIPALLFFFAFCLGAVAVVPDPTRRTREISGSTHPNSNDDGR